MNIHRVFRSLLSLSLALLATTSCIPSASTPPATFFLPTEIQNTETRPVFTDTAPPSGPTATVAGNQEVTVTNIGPSCTVLQDLNLRSGPGMAYRPPIRALPATSSLIPLGFAPKGVPGGSWAFVEDGATKDQGWVSAGSQYISCNIELASLPAVAFDPPPPPPLPKSTQTSDPDGSGFCVDATSGYQCVGIFSSQSLFQFQILKDGIEQGQNDGVGPVTFTITRNDTTVYSTVENNAPYCILGGNGPCNGWVLEDWVYKWSPEGASVEPGEYKLNVDTTANGENTHWEVEFTVALP